MFISYFEIQLEFQKDQNILNYEAIVQTFLFSQDHILIRIDKKMFILINRLM